MTFVRTNRDIQIRVNSLGILQNAGIPELVVDGQSGPATRRAVAFVKDTMSTTRTEDMFHPAGINRVHWHWTGGSYTVGGHTVAHYNDVFGHDGVHYDGYAPALHQAYYAPNRTGVSHTLRANTGAIGLSVAGMYNAQARGNSVDTGRYPLTWDGIDAMLKRTAEYCSIYDIRVSPWTTLTHAEVQSNIGISQRGKWDIQVLPDNPNKLLDAEEVGGILRQRMADKFL